MGATQTEAVMARSSHSTRKPYTEFIQVAITPDLKKKAIRMADREDMSLSAFLRRTIEAATVASDRRAA